ncbi:MAG TPA: HAMP domain-containing sensor histidine kinase [Methylomirabilota bacterium]|nr:HAMP domain-containing sensor histidine kinase [Methylomirabilota bacterium]
MRLASKIFLASSLVIVILAGVGVLSLRAIGRLASVNREIALETVPALRLIGGLRDALAPLDRLAARYAVLRDPRYAALWRDGAERASQDLIRLRDYVKSEQEANHLRAATAAFEQYRTMMAAEQARLMRDRTRSLVPNAGSAQAHADRAEHALETLNAATHARIIAVQAEAARLERRTWTGVVVAFAAGLVLALLGTAFIAVRMTRSLRRLSHATAAVASGSFREPIEISGHDEIGELARSFNAMAAQLQRLDDTKEEFFATLSHELRSPLTSVREAANLLRDEVAGPLTSKQARLVEIVQGSANRLLRLVNQILEMSRLRAGVLPLARAPLDLGRVIGRALDELRPQAEEGRVALERERVGDAFNFVGDEERLLQVVVNLVANAIRFTPAGGRVIVRLVDAGPEIELQVEDTGAGIPAAALPHIFESYRQAHRDRGGTGLGLAIVRGVVQAHGGRVTVESHEGKGSRFTVLLPRSGAAA